MRICVPTATDDGLDAAVHGHFGSAPYFSILDTETGAVEAVRNANEHHEHGQCNPVGALTGLNPDAVVVRGIGRGALVRLTQAGIAVYVAEGATLAEVGVRFQSGDVRAMDFDSACHGHSHGDHGHDHHHHHHHA